MLIRVSPTLVLFELRFGYFFEFLRRRWGGAHWSRLMPWLLGDTVSSGRLFTDESLNLETMLVGPQDVPEGLLRQMGAYAAMLQAIYPNRQIETAILWTRTAALMPIPRDLITQALTRAALDADAGGS